MTNDTQTKVFLSEWRVVVLFVQFLSWLLQLYCLYCWLLTAAASIKYVHCIINGCSSNPKGAAVVDHSPPGIRKLSHHAAVSSRCLTLSFTDSYQWYER